MRRNVLLLFWALYRLKCGDTVEVRHAPRATRHTSTQPSRQARAPSPRAQP